MKILLNTETKEIREKGTRFDRNRPKDSTDADILNIMMIALVGKIMKVCKSDASRKRALDTVYESMQHIMQENS